MGRYQVLQLSFLLIIGLVIVMLGCSFKRDPIIDTHWDFAPSWSNAGDKITFTRPGIEDSIFAEVLYLIDTTGTEITPLTIGGMYATWLPGDSEIVFFKGNFKLYYMNLNTMQELLLCDCSFARFPDYDINNNLLYYEDQGVSHNWATSIYKMDLTTGDTTHIVGGSFPQLSPDGRYLLISRHQVYRYDLITDSNIVVFNYGNEYDWSPDGSKILIGNFTKTERLYKIYEIDSDGSNSKSFTSGKYPRYSPNGDRIVVAKPSADERNHLWLIDREGKNPKQITF